MRATGMTDIFIMQTIGILRTWRFACLYIVLLLSFCSGNVERIVWPLTPKRRTLDLVYLTITLSKWTVYMSPFNSPTPPSRWLT